MFSIRKKLKQVQTKRKLVSCYSRKIPITGFKFVMLRTYCNTVGSVLVQGLFTLDTKDTTVTDQAFTFCWDDCSALVLSDLHRTSEKEKKTCMCTMRSWGDDPCFLRCISLFNSGFCSAWFLFTILFTVCNIFSSCFIYLAQNFT